MNFGRYLPTLGRAVHPAIALGDISIEIVAAEHDLKCPRAADQTREPFQRSAAGTGPTPSSGLPNKALCRLAELVTNAARAAANLGDAQDWRERQAQ